MSFKVIKVKTKRVKKEKVFGCYQHVFKFSLITLDIKNSLRPSVKVIFF